MKYNKQIKTGILAIIGITCFVIGFNFLKSKNIFSNDNIYYAKFNHSGGLNAGTSVTINGFKVGTVNKISIEDGTGKILVTFSVEKDIKLSKTSKAELFTSLLGNTGLQIVPRFNEELAKSGDTLPSNIQIGMLESLTSKIEPTQEKLNTLLNTSDTVLTSISHILDKKGEENLKKSLESLNSTLTNLNKISMEFSEIISKNKNGLSSTLNNLTIISDNLAQLTDSLKNANVNDVIKKANHSLANVDKIISEIEEGKGTLGMLMKDKELYTNLNQASNQLGLLLQDFRLNPKRYVHFSIFGKKQKNYESPEKIENTLEEQEK